LARHPAGDDFVRAPLVEAMQPLNGDDHPVRGAWHLPHPRELRLGAFRVAVEADEQRRGSAAGRRHDEIAAMRCCCDVALDHQITFTAPEARISASRVMSGIAIVCAEAQINASNGSRVKVNASAAKTCSGVTSSG